ncbi:MAG TPA: tetratricopeptide repeat protein [Thermoanaerobaculia bacterium]|nr:tetratricopeptide repeat protein [Thermoanaerobaculia bacterium]
MRRRTGLGPSRPGALLAALALLFPLLLSGLPASAQVLQAPGEATESTFRREVRGQWFAWLAAHEEGDPLLAAQKVEEIVKHARKIGLKRLTDLSLAATLLARREVTQGSPEKARWALDAAVRLDPDLPEARWARVGLALKADLLAAPRELLGAIRASVVDLEGRRVLYVRTSLLLVLTLAAVGLSFVVLLVAGTSRRLFHDLTELAGRWVPRSAEPVVALALFLLPLLLALDVGWLLLWLFVLSLGYAERNVRWAAVAGLVPLLFVAPALDRAAVSLSSSASPVLRGAEALEEKRYDQRVLDDLEAVKALFPEDADIRFLLGCLYQQLGQNDRAVAEYTVASQASTAEVRALINRGDIRFVDGDFGAAQEDFQEALRRDPRDVRARYNLSLVYGETFRTVEAQEKLSEARALDNALVTRFLDSPTLVKVVSLGFTPDEARAKIALLQRDPRSRRILGHFHLGSVVATWAVPLAVAIPFALVAAFLLDSFRRKGYGYALACQKCGRTFCRLCKPPGESPLLCSQCVHVYLKKDGVSIETKLQKVEEVKRRQGFEGRLRRVLNLLLPGGEPFLDGRVAKAAAILAVFFFALLAALFREHLALSPRPGAERLLAGTLLWGLVAAGAWVSGQLAARKG